jgi:hypothetical protein
MSRRAATLLVIIGLASLLVVPAGSFGARADAPGTHPRAPAAVLAVEAVPTISDRSAAGPASVLPLSAFSVWNRTIAPALLPHPALGGEPVSAVPVEPLPALPGTTPVTVSLASDLVNCCLRENVSLPNGTWARIVLNYTGQAIGGVYDSSYRMYIDHVPVLFGTTPEYGTWTVLQDLTEYSVLLHGITNVSFLLGAALVGGKFLSNVTLSFYPVPAGAVAPTEPTEIVPLWSQDSVRPGATTEYDVVNMPHNATNATLELWAYGFGGDEFWYAEAPPASAYRAATVSVNGTAIATEYPFPFINTGGIDLYLWRPVTAVATLNDRPQRFDLTGALGLLEGTRNLTVSFAGISTGSDWIVDGAMLLYTNRSVTGAQSTAATGGPSVGTLTKNGIVSSQTGSASYHLSSAIDWANGSTSNVTTTTSQSFDINTSVPAGGAWQNISLHSRLHTVTVANAGGASTFANRTFDAPFSVDLGQTAKLVRSTGSGNYYNFTSYFLNGVQVWNETSSSTATGPVETQVDDQLAGADGVYSGQEEVTGANSALLVAIYNISTETPREFAQSAESGALHATYVHLVVASGVNPPGPDNAANVVTNTLTAPMDAAGTASRSEVEVGAATWLTVEVLGGLAPYQYFWNGLPPGCASSDSMTLRCVPSSAGTFPVEATVRDSTGTTALVELASLLVLPDATVTVHPSTPGVDLGGSLSLNVTIVGGFGPYLCSWYVDGGLVAPLVSCALPYSTTPSSVGPLTANVSVTDADGVSSASPAVTVPVATPVAVHVTTSRGGSGSVDALTGTLITLEAQVAGGVGPYAIDWDVDGHPRAVGWSLNLTANASASQQVVAYVSDASGDLNQSSAFTVHGESPASASGTAGTVSSAWEVLAVAGFCLAGALAVVLAVLLRRRR